MSNKKRETKTLKLPTGEEAVIFTNFTRADEKVIRKAQYGDTIKFSVDGDEKTGEIPMVEMQDKYNDALVLQGTQSITVDGQKKDISKKLIDEMNVEDFRFILDTLSDIFLGKRGKSKSSKK